MPTLLFPIRALSPDGIEYWYTGKAGPEWLSLDRADAYVGYSLEGAQRRAQMFNRDSAVHGLQFSVPGAPASK